MSWWSSSPPPLVSRVIDATLEQIGMAPNVGLLTVKAGDVLRRGDGPTEPYECRGTLAQFVATHDAHYTRIVEAINRADPRRVNDRRNPSAPTMRGQMIDFNDGSVTKVPLDATTEVSVGSTSVRAHVKVTFASAGSTIFEARDAECFAFDATICST